MFDEFYSLHDLALQDPLGDRDGNSHHKGITMIIDKGLGRYQFQDMLETAGAYIDFIKLGFGTTALYPYPLLQLKIEWTKACQLDIYPGGTFFEVAYQQGKMERYFFHMKQLGFTKIEISDGTISIPLLERLKAIAIAKEFGLDVITEYGKKVTGSQVEWKEMMETISSDLEQGASYVIIEGRESGEDVGIYDSNGEIQESFKLMLDTVSPFQKEIIWEAPKKNQQVDLIQWFGPNVNLGNIAPEEIMSLESLRRGLRSDTFFLDRREPR